METLGYLPGLRNALLAMLAICLASIFGALEPLDELLYASAVRLVGEQRGESRVLLVETALREAPDWPRLRENLSAAGIDEMVLLDPPPAIALEALANGPGARVSIALPVVEDPLLPGELVLAEPRGGIPAAVESGVLTTLAEHTGFVRRQALAVELRNGRRVPTIEALVARRSGVALPVAPYLINFHHGLSLPRTDAAAVETAPPIAELARSRVVLVGAARAPRQPEFRAPGTVAGHELSALEFHGLALDTLLRQQVVRVPGAGGTTLIILALGSALLLVFQPMQLRSALWSAAVLSALLLAGSAAALRWLDWWLAPLPGLLVLFAVLAAVFREKAVSASKRINGLMQLATAKLQNRVLPAGFAESSEHWAYVINLVDQTLLLNRSIFLERTPDDHRVREIKSLRCSISDISEMRRDFERAPYTTAMEHRGTIEINPQRPYLHLETEDERQFLTPLVFAGEVQGFWAFGVLREKIDNDPQFLATADRLAEQIAVLLYERKIWQQQSRAESTWRRYLADDGSEAMAELGRAVTAMEQRLAGFEEVFASLHTAATYYDLFGRVVLINDKMSELLADWQLSPYEMTAVDLICALSGRPADEVREAIRKLVFDQQTLVLGVARGERGHRHLLHVRPLRREGEADEAGVSEHGILLEMVDVAGVRQAMELKADALHFVFHELASRVRAIGPPTGQPERRAHGLDEANALLDRVEQLFDQELEGERAFALYPVQLQPLLEEALADAAEALEARELRTAMRSTGEAGLVFAEPEALTRLLGHIVELLIGDALSGSEIEIHIDDRGESSLVEFSNTGFGIPDDRLQALLSPLSEIEEPLWAGLRAAPRQLARWGGECRLSSRIGAGFRVELQLRRLR